MPAAMWACFPSRSTCTPSGIIHFSIGDYSHRRSDRLAKISQAGAFAHVRARAIASVTGFDRRLWMVIFRRRNRVKCEFRLLNGSFCTAEVEIPPPGALRISTRS